MALIFDSNVDGGMPSLADAPNGPDTLPRASARAESIIFRSSAADLLNDRCAEPGWDGGAARKDFFTDRVLFFGLRRSRTTEGFRFLAAQYYTVEMSKHLESLHQNLLHGKLPHNLNWSEAVELVEHLGEVQPQGDDAFVFRVGSQRAFFKRPHTHDLGVEEVSRLRKFLQAAGSGERIEEPAKPARTIVVIDHRAAHVYQDFGGSRPADEHTVRPYDPFNFHHHLIHRKEAHYRGERVPEEHSFYEEVAKDLTPAKEIVLIGHATGKSNAADFFKEYLKTHHPAVSRRVIASESADLSAVTEREIEALAKRHMIAVV